MVDTQPLVLPATDLVRRGGTVWSEFSKVVTMRASVTAVRDEAIELSYAELDLRASVLARSLTVAMGGARGNVGILLDQSAAAIIAMLGALKAGRPFVPLDPMLPAARLGQILALAGVTVCVTDTAHQDMVAAIDGPSRPTPIQIVTVDAGGQVGQTAAAGDLALDEELPGLRALPSDPAFVIFSSGSTGVPKGVIWRHQTVVHELETGVDQLGVNATDQMALILPIAFAAGITVMFWGLLSGATLHVLDPRARGIGVVPGWLATREITTLHLTPALIRALVGTAEPGQVPASLRAVTSSGEAVYGREVAALREILPRTCTFYNWSGSTETASLAFFPVRADDALPAGSLPVGWPVRGKTIEIVDEHGNPVPVGATGEITVTSEYLSGGYWNTPEMTTERFRPAGVNPESGELVAAVTYRAGDLARQRPDGCVELLGRADAAVKIRGYLVEPAEIEAVLLTSPDIVEAVVVAQRPEDQPARLIAYVVCKSAVKSAAVTVRTLLRAKLPSYMVPSSVVVLDELPRNERGKVDRTALPPVPPREPGRLPSAHNHWEIAVRDLFAQVLKVDDIGLDDDFVELGGDSILAQQLLSEIATRMGVRLHTSALVEAPTAATLAARVAGAHRDLPTHPTCVPLNVGGSRPPLFCVAGAGGLAISFVALSRLLGTDLPCYGFQAQGLESRAFPDWTIERHARRHLAALRLIQPAGPYHIAGFSFGGLVAMEMAHLLAEAGEEVALLILIDSKLPRSAQAGPAASSPTRMVERRLPVPGLAKVSGLARVPSLAKVRKVARLPMTGLIHYSGVTHFNAFFDQSRVVAQTYRMRPYAGRSLLYLAKDNSDSDRDGWPNLLTGEATVVTVPGEHHSMLFEPYIGALAADMRARLDEVWTK